MEAGQHEKWHKLHQVRLILPFLTSCLLLLALLRIRGWFASHSGHSSHGHVNWSTASEGPTGSQLLLQAPLLAPGAVQDTSGLEHSFRGTAGLLGGNEPPQPAPRFWPHTEGCNQGRQGFLFPLQSRSSNRELHGTGLYSDRTRHLVHEFPWLAPPHRHMCFWPEARRDQQQNSSALLQAGSELQVQGLPAPFYRACPGFSCQHHRTVSDL